MKKNGMKKWLALSMVSLMGVSMFACDNNTDGDGDTSAAADGYAYMAIDINPTVEFVLQADKVVSVDAVNDDAAVLVSEEELVGMTAEEAAETVVELAEDLGYINEDNVSVKITVAADDETQEEALKEKVKLGAIRGSVIAKINCEPRNADARKAKKLKEENPELYKGLTPAKVRLIEAIMRYDDSMTYEIGVEMNFDELAEILEEYVEEFKDIYGEKLREEYKATIEAKKQEAEMAIAEIYGEEFKAAVESYHALKTAYKALEMKAESMVISAEDVETILALLELENAELISVSGNVTVESVDRYLDRNFVQEHLLTEEEKEALERIEESVEDILDKYDEDEYLLTEEDLAMLGEAIELELGATLEDLEELLEDLEENLEDLKESLDLEGKIKEQIFELKEEMKDFKDEAHREMHDRIEQFKEDCKDIKEQRKQWVENGGRPPVEPQNPAEENPATDEPVNEETPVAEEAA